MSSVGKTVQPACLPRLEPWRQYKENRHPTAADPPACQENRYGLPMFCNGAHAASEAFGDETRLSTARREIEGAQAGWKPVPMHLAMGLIRHPAATLRFASNARRRQIGIVFRSFWRRRPELM